MASFSSPPRLPRGLRRRLSLVDCNKTPNTAEQIETKLRSPSSELTFKINVKRHRCYLLWMVSMAAAGSSFLPLHLQSQQFLHILLLHIHLPPAPSKVPPHPRPCPYRGSGIPPSSSPTSHPNPTVPPTYAPNGSPYSPSTSPYTSPSSQFLQAESLVEIQLHPSKKRLTECLVESMIYGKDHETSLFLKPLSCDPFAFCFSFSGWCLLINSTENRSVLHVALHAPRDTVLFTI
ncbi:unnamed protein product [Prunus brigantina]